MTNENEGTIPRKWKCHTWFDSSFKVQMHNGDVYEASIKDIDKKTDIATIKINTQVSPYPFGISAKISLSLI